MDFLIKQNAGEVSCNFEDIKKHLDEKLDEYRGIVFTEDSKKDAKNVVAELRKEKKAFSDKVKEVKAEYMKPWDEFNSKAQELVKMFDEPIDFINDQVSEFEKKRIEEKQLLISEIYMSNVPKELMVIIPLEKIYSNKWENATTSKKAIQEEIQKIVEKTAKDMQTIKSMESEAEEKAIAKYALTLDVGEAICLIQGYEKQKAEILSKQHERELESAKMEARAEAEAEIRHAEEIEKAKEDAVSVLIPEDDGEEKTDVFYIIKLTPSAKETLEMYLDSVGIEFNEIPLM